MAHQRSLGRPFLDTLKNPHGPPAESQKGPLVYPSWKPLRTPGGSLKVPLWTPHDTDVDAPMDLWAVGNAGGVIGSIAVGNAVESTEGSGQYIGQWDACGR